MQVYLCMLYVRTYVSCSRYLYVFVWYFNGTASFFHTHRVQHIYIHIFFFLIYVSICLFIYTLSALTHTCPFVRVWIQGRWGPKMSKQYPVFVSLMAAWRVMKNKGPHRAWWFRIEKEGQGSESKTWSDAKNTASKEKHISNIIRNKNQAGNQKCDVDSGLIMCCFVYYASLCVC